MLTNMVTRAVSGMQMGKQQFSYVTRDKMAQFNSVSKFALILRFKGKIPPKCIEHFESSDVFSVVKVRIDCLNELAVRCEDIRIP
jgi:hypothetical protein